MDEQPSITIRQQGAFKAQDLVRRRAGHRSSRRYVHEVERDDERWKTYHAKGRKKIEAPQRAPW